MDEDTIKSSGGIGKYILGAAVVIAITVIVVFIKYCNAPEKFGAEYHDIRIDREVIVDSVSAVGDRYVIWVNAGTSQTKRFMVTVYDRELYEHALAKVGDKISATLVYRETKMGVRLYDVALYK